MRQKILLIVIVAAFVGCFTGPVNADSPANSISGQDEAFPNDEDVHRNLRYAGSDGESNGSEAEERAGLQWLTKLKTRFVKKPNVAKSLEKNSELALTLQKNPQAFKQIENLQKKPGLIKRITNNPVMTRLKGRLAKNLVKFKEQNVKNTGKLATKTEESFLDPKIYIGLGIFVLFNLFIMAPILLLARKSG
ncbi:hypothetical protein DVH05_027856 [Phytophthora capsici]|nr:hypothetical protein DVH05_027856 [Phytophthora capsici]